MTDNNSDSIGATSWANAAYGGTALSCFAWRPSTGSPPSGLQSTFAGGKSMTMAAVNSPWADQVLPYEQHRNDLHTKVYCDCANPMFAGDAVLGSIMKTPIRLSGYSDTNFFDRVHAEPHEGSCSNCGRRYRFQWWRDGVAFAFLPAALATEAQRAETTKIGSVHEGAGPKDNAHE